MNSGKLATECEWISFVNYKDFKDDFQLGEFIRDEMSLSRAVVLRGYPYQGVQFGMENFWRAFKIPGDQVFVVSG